MKNFKVVCPACSIEFEPAESQNKFFAEELNRLLAKDKAVLQAKAAELREKEEALKRSEDIVKERVEAGLKQSLAEVEKKVHLDAAKRFESQFKDLQNQIQEKSQALSSATHQQLQLTKQLREAQQRQQQLDLEVEQKVMAQVTSIQADSMKRADELYKLKILEKDKKIRDIEEQLEAARRKAIQGSQQTQGEVVEIQFENDLAAKFPLDKFDPVPKGVDGADLIQTVVNSSGRNCGSIIWEFKNTKTFSNDWITKLKKDQRAVNADVAILVSRALPKGTADIEVRDGILLVSYELALPLAAIVRKSVQDLSYSQLVQQGQDEKMRLIYSYLTGNQFKQKVKAIVAAFQTLKENLEAEKRAFTRIWSSREKLLNQVIDSASSMYGDIEGIAGAAAPKIPELELPFTAMLESAKT